MLLNNDVLTGLETGGMLDDNNAQSRRLELAAIVAAVPAIWSYPVELRFV